MAVGSAGIRVMAEVTRRKTKTVARITQDLQPKYWPLGTPGGGASQPHLSAWHLTHGATALAVAEHATRAVEAIERFLPLGLISVITPGPEIDTENAAVYPISMGWLELERTWTATSHRLIEKLAGPERDEILRETALLAVTFELEDPPEIKIQLIQSGGYRGQAKFVPPPAWFLATTNAEDTAPALTRTSTLWLPMFAALGLLLRDTLSRPVTPKANTTAKSSTRSGSASPERESAGGSPKPPARLVNVPCTWRARSATTTNADDTPSARARSRGALDGRLPAGLPGDDRERRSCVLHDGRA